MAKSHKFFKKAFLSHFTVEILLLLIFGFTLGTNVYLRLSSASGANKSLFFVYLKNHESLNPKLVDAYESISLKTSPNHNFEKQILAASTKDKDQVVLAKNLPTLAGTVLLKPNPATSSNPIPKKDVEVYVVRPGDTVTRIAGAYGVSPETILGENNLTTLGLIRPGQELKILPVSGVRHIVKEGETLSLIAKKYGLVDDEDLEAILEYNEIEIEDHIFPEDEIIIPGGIKKIAPTPARRQYLADLRREDYQKYEVPGDFTGDSTGLIWPMPQAQRLSQRYWSRHRGIDIPCRDCQIIASASGIVELSGWQRGYGYTIVINHGQGVKTRYAHGKELLVKAGENVAQGQAIMISGTTGRSTGPHLHFEVKKNGVLLDPLTLVSR